MIILKDMIQIVLSAALVGPNDDFLSVCFDDIGGTNVGELACVHGPHAYGDGKVALLVEFLAIARLSSMHCDRSF